MKKPPTFKPRLRFADKIRDMKVKSQLYFRGGKPNSIKAIASRIGTKSDPKRIYYTQTEKAGVVVYRER